MKNLAKYLKNYKKQAVLAPAFKLAEALMDLIVPLAVAWIIDDGTALGNRSVIMHGFWLMILLAAAGCAFAITAQYFAAKASVGFATDVRQALFDHVESLSYQELDQLGTNTLITRMTSDVNQVQTGLNLALRLLLRSPFIVLGSMIMAFTINVRCALIFAIAVPLLSLVVFVIMIKSIPLYEKAQAILDRVLGIARENLTGVRVIRAFCKEEAEVKEFDEQNEKLTKMNLFVGRLSALMNPATYLLVNIAAILLIREGAVQVNIGTIEQGQVVALYNYMTQIIVELIKFASLVITINKSAACAERISSVLKTENTMSFPKETKLEKKNSSEVQFDHVSFRYNGDSANALEDIDFTVKKGETIGIIGPTGSGKSTLINLIPRFYDASEGTVRIDGCDIHSYTEEDIRSKVGIVPQKAVLFEGTIRDNLKFGNENAADEEINKAIQMAQAEDIVNGKEGKLDYVIEQNGRNLSGGQKQRLTIARALVRNPEILIMDDSTSALDFATDAAVRKDIKELNNGRKDEDKMTVFIVSERASSIMAADRIVVLADGKIAGIGSHQELMKNCSVYQEIFYSQFPEKKNQEVSA